MAKFLLLGAGGVAAMNATDNYFARMTEIKRINMIPGLTWKAGMSEKFKNQPLGSTALLGAKLDQMERTQRKIKEGKIELYQVPEGFTAPDDFDSAANWPECANVINDIRDQSNCGCCWAFGGASAASDRLCIATGGAVQTPISSEDVCFGASYDGCGGGYLDATWEYVQGGAVSGGNQDGTGALGGDFCQDFSLPHCHHHGPQKDDPYPAEGAPGCPSENSPSHRTACDNDIEFGSDKYSFKGSIQSYQTESAIQAALMEAGPVETAFTVYSDFENYDGGVYKKTSSQTLGGHAVRIVGWGVDAGSKYWKVANSWNPFWGEKGYFRIERGVDSCGIESQAMASSGDATWTYPHTSPPTNPPAPTNPPPPTPPTTPPTPPPTPAAQEGQCIFQDDEDGCDHTMQKGVVCEWCFFPSIGIGICQEAGASC